MQISDDLFLGPASAPGPTVSGNPSPMELGVGPMGRVYVYDIVPLTLQAAGLATAQANAGARDLTLTAGTGVTTSVDAAGTTRYVLDVPRSLSCVSANAGDTTQTVTFYGYDLYGQPMTQAVTLNGTTTVNTTKAFKSVTRIAISAASAGNVSAGYGDRFGLPYRVTDVAYLASVRWNSTLAQDAGTFVAAVQTDPATATTGDVRGTYLPSSAANGSRRLVIGIYIPALGSGPQATRVGAFGVAQA